MTPRRLAALGLASLMVGDAMNRMAGLAADIPYMGLLIAAVILVVPLAALGVVIAVLSQGANNNIYTQIGIVLLVALGSDATGNGYCFQQAEKGDCQGAGGQLAEGVEAEIRGGQWR